MAQRQMFAENDLGPIVPILQKLFESSNPQDAVRKIGRIPMSPLAAATDLSLVWTALIVAAREMPEEQDKLIEVVKHLTMLPDARTDRGGSLVVHGKNVWRDLPLLDQELHHEWDALYIADAPDSDRKAKIQRFINVNLFVARLSRAELPAVQFVRLLALFTMRTALETPLLHMQSNLSPDAFVPAAAAWISMLGTEIYWWEDNFEYSGLASPGKAEFSGLTESMGFAKTAGSFWRQRFAELSQANNGLSEDTRLQARQAGETMTQIEHSKN